MTYPYYPVDILGASLCGHGCVMAIPEALAPTHSYSNHSLWLVPRSLSPDETARTI